MSMPAIAPPERESQRVFRALLAAFSRPGRIVRLEPDDPTAPFSSARALARCLLDESVSVCVAGESPAARRLNELLERETRARPAGIEEADFLWIWGTGDGGVLSRPRRGTAEEPQRGATVVFCLEPGPSPPLPERPRVRLAGPGIEAVSGIAPEMEGIPRFVFEELAAVNAEFPLGVDVVFLRPEGTLMAVPRSTRIRIGG